MKHGPHTVGGALLLLGVLLAIVSLPALAPPPRTVLRSLPVIVETRAAARVACRPAPSQAARVAGLAVEGLQAELPALYAWRFSYPPRPRTRGDCASVPRPCPFISCKMNLHVELTKQGHLSLSHGEGADPLDVHPDESCALDVADRGESSQERVAHLLGGVTLEWIRRTERAAEAEMRVRGGPGLASLVEGGTGGVVEHVSANRGLGDVVSSGGGGGEHVDLAEREARRVEQWTEEVAALARAGIPLRAAWAIVNHRQDLEDEIAAAHRRRKKGGESSGAADQVDEGEGADEVLEVGEHRDFDRVDGPELVEDLIEDGTEETGAAAPTEDDMQTKTEKAASEATNLRAQRGAFRARVIAELEHGPLEVAVVAQRLGVDVETARDALRRLRIQGRAVSDNRGTHSRWSLVAHAQPPPAPMPGVAHAAPTVPPAEAPAPGVEAALVLELVRLAREAPEQLGRIERLLNRLGGGR